VRAWANNAVKKLLLNVTISVLRRRIEFWFVVLVLTFSMLEGLSLLFLSRVLSSCLDVRIKIRRMVETLPEGGDTETEHRTGEVKMELKEERREEEEEGESEELYEDPTESQGRMRMRKYSPINSFFYHSDRNTNALQLLLGLVC
jgi:hypothetical protein